MPGVIEIEFVDMEVDTDEVDVLLVVAGGHVAVGLAQEPTGGRGAGQLGEIVVMPRGIEIELEDVEVVPYETDVVDVLLMVERGHVAVETAWERGGWSTGEFGEIVVMPAVIVVELEDMHVIPNGTHVVDML